MGAHRVMRIPLDNMLEYLNAKRDQEIAYFKHCLNSALSYTKPASAADTTTAASQKKYVCRFSFASLRVAPTYCPFYFEGALLVLI